MRSPVKSVSKGGRLNLFLLEMIIVLLFFSIACAVILNAFVTADRISASNIRLERMAFCTQSVAEVFSETGDISETAETLFGITSENVSRITVPMDNECRYSPAAADIFMTVSIVETDFDGAFRTAEISFSDADGAPLYSVQTSACVTEGTVDFLEE